MGYPEFVNTMMNCCQIMQRVITFVALKRFMCLLYMSHRKQFSVVPISVISVNNGVCCGNYEIRMHAVCG